MTDFSCIRITKREEIKNASKSTTCLRKQKITKEQYYKDAHIWDIAAQSQVLLENQNLENSNLLPFLEHFKVKKIIYINTVISPHTQEKYDQSR